MHIFDLPIDVYKELFEHIVLVLGVNRSMKSRLVCKAFDEELVNALYSTKTIIKPSLPDSTCTSGYGVVPLEAAMGETAKWTSRLLQESVLDGSIRREPVFIVVKVIDALIRRSIDKTEETRIKYLSQISILVAIHMDPPVEALVPILSEEREKNHVELQGDDEIACHIISAAAWVGSLGLIKTIAEERRANSCDINPEDRAVGHCWDDTALAAACLSGHEDIVRLLLHPKYGFDTSSQSMEDALSEAASGGKVSILKFLLERGTFPDEDRSLCGRGKLRDGSDWPSRLQKVLWRACRDGSQDIVEMLLDMSVDPDIGGDGRNRTCIHVAALGGYSKIVEMLLSKGADYRKETYQLPRPLVLAARGGFARTINVLLDAGADITGCGACWCPLVEAAGRGHIDAVRVLLAGGLNLTDKDFNLRRYRALQAACDGGYSSVARVLAGWCCDLSGSDI